MQVVATPMCSVLDITPSMEATSGTQLEHEATSFGMAALSAIFDSHQITLRRYGHTSSRSDVLPRSLLWLLALLMENGKDKIDPRSQFWHIFYGICSVKAKTSPWTASPRSTF